MASLQEDLRPFLSAHPNSSLVEVQTDTGVQYELLRPWDDDSLKIVFPADPAPLAAALNNLILNYRFSAVYHIDLKAIEVIWTPFPLEDDIKDIEKRDFKFQFKSADYNCKFAPTSDRVLAISRSFEQIKFSETQTRNLDPFRMCLEATDLPFTPEYRSFWIENVSSFEEDDVVLLISNLNFYMTYFDWVSPMIIVHPPYRPRNSKITYIRYIDNAFPNSINGRPMDDNLLHFWLAAKTGDQSRKFIYYYRILEYCASVYVDYATRLALKKILLLPNSIDNIGYTEERIIGTLKQYTRKDRERMEAMLLELVDPKDLWPCIALNKESFISGVEFDGGFSIKALINDSCKSAEDWHNGVQNCCTHINQIRNALSHGQDQRSAMPILPTHANFEKLRPWVTLTAAAAGKVMILRGGL